MTTFFNPRYPSTENSLNRLRLVVADGHLLPEAIHGKSGYELASTHALVQLIQAHASTHEIAIPDTSTEQLTWFYEQAAAGTGFFVEIAEIIGMHLGCLLLTLLRNDSQTHAANADKDSAYWAYWSAVRTVYLGGGLVAGRMGSMVAAQAQAMVRKQANVSDYTVTAADYPQHLPLLGAARTVPHGNRALVLDFGGTFVKRALAHYTGDGLTRLHRLDSLPSNFQSETDEDVRLLFERMVNIIVQSYGDSDAGTIPISLAAYVDEHGRPLNPYGTYAQLRRLTDDVPGTLSQAVSDQLGKPVQVRMFHDGTAAALFYAPQERAAVMVLGTALGSGYPVSRPNLTLRPVSTSLIVTYAGGRE